MTTMSKREIAEAAFKAVKHTKVAEATVFMEEYYDNAAYEQRKAILEKTTLKLNSSQRKFIKAYEAMAKSEVEVNNTNPLVAKKTRKGQDAHYRREHQLILEIQTVREIDAVNNALERSMEEMKRVLVTSQIQQCGENGFVDSKEGRKFFKGRKKKYATVDDLVSDFIDKKGPKREAFKTYLQDPRNMNPDEFPCFEGIEALLCMWNKTNDVGDYSNNIGEYLTLFNFIFHLHIRKSAMLKVNDYSKLDAVRHQYDKWTNGNKKSKKSTRILPKKLPTTIASFEKEFGGNSKSNQPDPKTDYPNYQSAMPDF